MANITVDITVVCDECKDTLDATWDNIRDELRVEPCEQCLRNATDEGYADGQNSMEE